MSSWYWRPKWLVIIEFWLRRNFQFFIFLWRIILINWIVWEMMVLRNFFTSKFHISELIKTLLMLPIFFFHLILNHFCFLLITNLLLCITIIIFRNLNFDFLSFIENITFMLTVSIYNLIHVVPSGLKLTFMIVKYLILGIL